MVVRAGKCIYLIDGITRFSKLAVLLLLFTATAGNAQPVLKTRVSQRSVEKGQTFQVQYSVNAHRNAVSFIPPVYPAFSLVDQYIAPHPSPAGQTEYVCILIPLQSGRLEIPGASVRISGKRYTFPGAEIEVTSGRSADLPEVADQSFLQPGESIAQKIQQNLYLSARLSKTVCYVGEPIQAEYAAYSRLNAESQVQRRPAFTGFSVLDMVADYAQPPGVEAVKGIPFYKHIIRKVQLFPLQAGSYAMDNAEVESVVHFRKPADRNMPIQELKRLLDPRSVGPVTTVPYRHRVLLRSPEMQVTVLPLPENGQPASFSGAVGNFTITSVMDTGKENRLAVTISGWGNFPLITAPEIRMPAGLQAVPAGTAEQVSAELFPLNGSKTFYWDLIYAAAASYTIPPISFSYFDPANKRYQSIQTMPLTVTISPAALPVNTLPGETEAPADTTALRYIGFGLVIALVLIVLLVQLFRRKSPALKHTPSAPVTPMPEQPLSLLLEFQHTARVAGAPQFFLHARNLLIEAAADIADQGKQVDNEALAVALKQSGLPDEVYTSWKTLLSECEWALFTPGYALPDQQQFYTRVAACYVQLRQWQSR